MELDEFVSAFIERPNVRCHRHFCEQISNAASSAPSNIAEGFARFGLRDFARYLRIAKGELGEVETRLLQAKHRGYLAPEEYAVVAHLAKRAFLATTRLLASVEGRN